jgi:hypothetical protein
VFDLFKRVGRGFDPRRQIHMARLAKNVTYILTRPRLISDMLCSIYLRYHDSCMDLEKRGDDGTVGIANKRSVSELADIIVYL